MTTCLPSRAASSRFNQEYYSHVYRDYDRQNPAYKLRHYARVVDRWHDPALPQTIHDVGCAFGRFLGTLSPQWRRMGSDVSEYAIGRARQERPECGFAVADMGRVEAFSGKAISHQHSTFPPFAVVTAFDSLEHMPDVEAVGENIHRQLLPGGLFVFVVPVYDGLSGPVIRRLDRDPTHLHKWPRRRWLEWAARRFELVEWHGILRYLLPGGWYVHWPTRRMRWHTPAVLVVGRKGKV